MDAGILEVKRGREPAKGKGRDKTIGVSIGRKSAAAPSSKTRVDSLEL